MNIMILFRFSSLLILFLTFLSTQAQARWGLLAGAGKHSYVSSNSSSKGKFAPLGGLGYFDDSFEADLLFKIKAYGSSVTGKSLHLPMFYRFPMNSPLQVGLGAFADYSFTEINEVSKLDYGLAGSVQWKMPFSGGSSFLLDGRYEFGIADLNGANSRDITFLIGLVFN